MNKPCAIAGCHRPSRARGWCGTHYARWATHGDPSVAKKHVRGDAVARLWAYVEKTETCWNYTGATNEWGYGRFWTGRVRTRAHRFSWEIHNGAIPAGMFVCHKCDNPKCVRPDHMFLGAHADNMRDMAVKGRRKGVCAGETHGNALLTDETVLAIRVAGLGPAAAARQFGIAKSTAFGILRGVSWRHLLPEVRA